MKLLVLSVACMAILSAPAAQTSQPQDDTIKIKAVLLDFFNGISTQDFEKLKASVTSDFVLYEDGRIWNLDSAAMNIRRNMPFSVDYHLSNMKLHVDTQSADITYTNHADFTFAKGKLSLDWIESATFRKSDGNWKINFLQVTIRK
jgi:ketosteroid isomerase-like protein